PIVLQIGSRFINIGIAGESEPLLTFSTQNFSQMQLFQIENDSHKLNTAAIYDLQRFNYLFAPNLSIYKEKTTLINSFQYNLDSHLFRILHHLFRRLKLDVIKSKIIILEPFELNQIYKKSLTDQLLLHLQARSITFIPSPLMNTVAAGVRNGLVMDFGWNFTVSQSIFDLVVLENTSMLTTIAGHTIPSWLKYKPIEQLFYDDESTWEKNDLDEKSPVQLLLDQLKQLPIDIRKEMVNCVILTGGISKIPGFRLRFRKELDSKLDKHAKESKIVNTLGEWRGASLYSSTILLRSRHLSEMGELKRENY
ncbi:hypothetical protein CANARDRAFT_185764, partial [[Candida] arabinofermentans NRRL YB-2248]